MYLKSGVDYYVVVLEGIEVTCISSLRIMSPNIKFRLLSYPDLSKINLMLQSGMSKEDIYEEVCKKSILGIIGFDDEFVDFDNSPAGIVGHIGFKILENSKQITNDIEESFNILSSSISLYERISMVVSYYSNIKYEDSQQLPLDELIKRYAICSMAFPNTVPPIVLEKEEESKVGG